MKKILFILSVLLFSAAAVSAQDIITKKNGEDIKAKVLEIDTRNVKYRLFDEPDGVIYTIPKLQVILIRYESGRNEVFGSDTFVSGKYDDYRQPVADIRPGMKYSELKHLYNYQDWYSGYGDRYNPALMGVCSWIIPGLGQMISGEIGRGFGWLGGSVGCYLLIGIGASVNFSAYSDYDGGYNDAMAAAGTIITLAGYLGLLTVDVCAIVDACRVAKVRNMYEQDLRRQNWSLELRPSVDCIMMPGGMQPTTGLTLAMRF